MLPLKWLGCSSVGRPDDVEEHNLAFVLSVTAGISFVAKDQIRAIQVPALDLEDAGREASASWSQRPGHGGLESAVRPDSNPRSVVSAEQKKILRVCRQLPHEGLA